MKRYVVVIFHLLFVPVCQFYHTCVQPIQIISLQAPDTDADSVVSNVILKITLNTIITIYTLLCTFVT